jgi:hypothetical protein
MWQKTAVSAAVGCGNVADVAVVFCCYRPLFVAENRANSAA